MFLGNLNLISNDITYVHPASNTSELDLVEVTASDEFPVLLFKINLDASELLQNTTFRLYYKVDGTNYRLRYSTGPAGGTIAWLAATDAPQVSFLVNDIIDHDLKITIQSSSGEASNRNVYITYNGAS